ncbi:MAG: hypothetical protein QNJ84_03665 [Alphaproteobacteria bacterium]|nr:hypothetical protein [Alphaproteobacteria bacterium]
MTAGIVEFEPVIPTEAQIDHLFELLKARRHRISHQDLPSFAEHKRFVEAHPYRVWYLVKWDGDLVGGVYLGEDNAIGVNIEDRAVDACLGPALDKIIQEFDPLPSIPSVRPNRFYINVPPSNAALIAGLEKRGCALLQLSFALTNPD